MKQQEAIISLPWLVLVLKCQLGVSQPRERKLSEWETPTTETKSTNLIWNYNLSHAYYIQFLSIPYIA